MSPAAIDLNADLGEGFGSWTAGHDEALIGLVTSACVACGFHAGDPTIMRRSCELAREHDVRIGAHIGYRDLAGFGRRDLAVAPEVVYDEALYQIGALAACARAASAELSFVKPHGALYHRAATETACARAIVDAAAAVDPGLAILGPPQSRLLAVAAGAGLPAVAEAFVDRPYRADGSLISRDAPESILGVRQAVAQALDLAERRKVEAPNGDPVPVQARSLCLHGDGPHAVELARAVREAVQASGIELRAFA